MFPQLLLDFTLTDVTFKLCFAFKTLKGIRAETAFRISLAIPQFLIVIQLHDYKKSLTVKK